MGCIDTIVRSVNTPCFSPHAETTQNCGGLELYVPKAPPGYEEALVGFTQPTTSTLNAHASNQTNEGF